MTTDLRLFAVDGTYGRSASVELGFAIEIQIVYKHIFAKVRKEKIAKTFLPFGNSIYYILWHSQLLNHDTHNTICNG